MEKRLSVNIHPWQLFRFRKWVEITGKKPSDIIQEALQIYFSQMKITDKEIQKWLKEYHEIKREK